MPSPEGRRLDPRYRIELFSQSETVDEDAVVDLWTRERVLDEAEARERAAQVALVAVERDEGVVGVATTTLRDVPHLGMTLWAYRTFVAAAHREEDLAFVMVHATRDHLSERFTSGDDTRAPGMIMEVQSEILKRFRNQAVWSSRFAFIGEDDVGAHHRVYYFPGAMAPEPPL